MVRRLPGNVLGIKIASSKASGDSFNEQLCSTRGDWIGNTQHALNMLGALTLPNGDGGGDDGDVYQLHIMLQRLGKQRSATEKHALNIGSWIYSTNKRKLDRMGSQ